jgi:hypothetical protein
MPAVAGGYIVAIVGVTGTIIGAIIGSFSASWLDTRKRRRADRRALAAEVAAHGHNVLALFQEVDIRHKSEGGLWLADITRNTGALIGLEFRAWALFPERRVRAAFARLLSRIETVRDRLALNTCVGKEAQVAVEWFKAGLGELIAECAAAAGIALRDPARLYFVGWRRVTPDDKRSLRFEDDPPPWDFNLSIDFRGSPATDQIEGIRRSITSKVSSARCLVHQRPAHVLLHGPIEKFDIQITACCQDFSNQVLRTMARSRERGG